jgi:hypothetical protein
LARNARVAGSSSESAFMVLSALGLIEVRVTAALRRRSGKADALPHARDAGIGFRREWAALARDAELLFDLRGNGKPFWPRGRRSNQNQFDPKKSNSIGWNRLLYFGSMGKRMPIG